MKSTSRAVLSVVAVVGVLAVGAPATAVGNHSPYSGTVVGDPNATVSFNAERKRGSVVLNIEATNVDAICGGQAAELNISFADGKVKRRGKFSAGNPYVYFKGTLRKNGTATGVLRFNGVVNFGPSDNRICETGEETWNAQKSAF